MKTIFRYAALIAVLFSLFSCNSLVESQLRKQLESQIESQKSMLTSETMRIVTLGTGGPLPNEARVSSGIGIVAGGEFVIFDVGPGIVRNMGVSGLPAGNLSALFITHFHSDHISELGEMAFMTWAAGRPQKLDVYGPTGIEQVVEGYNMAYGLDSGYRTAHHSEEWMPSSAAGMIANTIQMGDEDEMVPVFDRNGLKIFAFPVDHSPVEPVVGYRIEYKGNAVVISGDTVKIPALTKFAKDADLFFCDALNADLIMTISRLAGEVGNHRLEKQMADVTDYHMTPVQAAEIARDANVKTLVLVHVVPPVTNFMVKRMFMESVDDVFKGKIILGEDLDVYELKPKI